MERWLAVVAYLCIASQNTNQTLQRGEVALFSRSIGSCRFAYALSSCAFDTFLAANHRHSPDLSVAMSVRCMRLLRTVGETMLGGVIRCCIHSGLGKARNWNNHLSVLFCEGRLSKASKPKFQPCRTGRCSKCCASSREQLMINAQLDWRKSRVELYSFFRQTFFRTSTRC